jgi:hypothetical protein
MWRAIVILLNLTAVTCLWRALRTFLQWLDLQDEIGDGPYISEDCSTQF